MHVRLACGLWLALWLNCHRGGRSTIEPVTVVIRFFFTTISHSRLNWPPAPSACSFVVPVFRDRTASPFFNGSSFTESRYSEGWVTADTGTVLIWTKPLSPSGMQPASADTRSPALP